MAAPARPADLARGLRRQRAAGYIGVSPGKFDQWTKSKIMPAGRLIDGVRLWDIRELDSAFDAMYYGAVANGDWTAQ